MPQSNTVYISIPVELDAAAVLIDDRTRASIGRLVSRVLRPHEGSSPLSDAIAELKVEARKAGLTDTMIDEELDAYNAERRTPT